MASCVSLACADSRPSWGYPVAGAFVQSEISASLHGSRPCGKHRKARYALPAGREVSCLGPSLLLVAPSLLHPWLLAVEVLKTLKKF